MNLTTSFDIPDHIATGLATGRYVRRGGVIQVAKGWQDAGNTVAWLRESPIVSRATGPAGLAEAVNLLGMIGSGGSIINVGLTLGFGLATLKKLGRVEGAIHEEAGRVHAHLDRVQARFDGRLDDLHTHLEMMGLEFNSAFTGVHRHLSDLQQQVDCRIAGIHEHLGYIYSDILRLGSRIDTLQWSMDLGFASIAAGIQGLAGGVSDLASRHEGELKASVQAAAELMAEAQLLGPGSAKRTARIENALLLIKPVCNQLQSLASLEIDKAVPGFMGLGGRDRLNITSDDLNAIRRLRQATGALALKIMIHAEAGDAPVALSNLTAQYGILHDLHQRLGRAFVVGNGSTIYDDLLNRQWADSISPAMIAQLGLRYDSEIIRLDDIIERLRKCGSVLTPVNQFIQWDRNALRNLPDFIEQLNGSYLDLDRIDGYLAEYETIGRLEMSVHEYRRMLEITEIPPDQGLVFFMPQMEKPKRGRKPCTQAG